jgi:hypothetical protein
VQGSPFAVAEVAVRSERQRGEDPNLATLVVFQDEHRVELSILQSLGLVFSHHTRVKDDDERSIRGTMAEINRSIIVLGQSMHTTFEVARVCLIHDGEVDPALERALSERFGGRLHVIDPAADDGISVASKSDAVRLAALAPALGALLGDAQRTVPSIDLLNPRKPPPKRDERKRRLIIGGAAAAAVLLIAATAAWSYASGVSAEILDLEARDADLTKTLKEGEPAGKSHAAVASWVNGAVDPLQELERLNRNLPGTDRLLLLDVLVAAGRNEAVSRLTGTGIARTERDIEDMFQTLADRGYRVHPQVTEPYKLDPDYPYQFKLDVERLPPRPASATTSKTAKAGTT